MKVLTDQDMNVLGFIIESGKALVIAINKWDGLDEEHKEHVKDEIDPKITFCKFCQNEIYFCFTWKWSRWLI